MLLEKRDPPRGGASDGDVADSSLGSSQASDRLHNLANHHETVRAILGHSDFADKTHYELQTIVDNVSLMRPELLAEVGRLVVESGHAVARKKPGGRLRGRCDSFVVETDVHYPTDLGLQGCGV